MINIIERQFDLSASTCDAGTAGKGRAGTPEEIAVVERKVAQ